MPVSQISGAKPPSISVALDASPKKRALVQGSSQLSSIKGGGSCHIFASIWSGIKNFFSWFFCGFSASARPKPDSTEVKAVFSGEKNERRGVLDLLSQPLHVGVHLHKPDAQTSPRVSGSLEGFDLEDDTIELATSIYYFIKQKAQDASTELQVGDTLFIFGIGKEAYDRLVLVFQGRPVRDKGIDPNCHGTLYRVDISEDLLNEIRAGHFDWLQKQMRNRTIDR